MFVYFVSPEYLDPVCKELSNFSVGLVGHGNYEAAYRGLIHVNISEIISLAILSEKLPVGPELEFMKKLIRLFDRACDKVDFKRRLVICMQSLEGLVGVLKSCNIKNLEVYADNYEIVTDLYIKREFMGSCITGYKMPYKDSASVSVDDIKNNSLKQPSYNSVLPSNVLHALAKVRILPDLERTLAEDQYLNLLKGSSDFYYRIRTLLIHSMFTDETIKDEVVENRIKNSADELKPQYSVIYSYVCSRFSKKEKLYDELP